MEKLWLKHYPDGVLHKLPPLDQKLVGRFESACREFGNRPAFISFGKSLSYKELWGSCLHFSAFLQSAGFKPGDRIALQLPNILSHPVSLWGSWMAGLTVVPLSVLSPLAEILPSLKQSRAKGLVLLSPPAPVLKKLLSETDLRLVIVTGPGDLLDSFQRTALNMLFGFRKIPSLLKFSKLRKFPSLPQSPAGRGRSSRVVSFLQALRKGAKQTLPKSPDSRKRLGDSGRFGKGAKQPPAKIPDRAFDDTVLIPFTGGATGKPKAVLLSQRNLLSNLKQCELWMLGALKRGEERALCALPLSHIFALMLNALVFCLNGYSNILIADPRKIGALARVLRKRRPTVGIGVDRLFKALLENPKFRALDFSGWKIFIAGGTALSPDTQRLWREVTKSRLLEGYGLTEASPVVTCPRLDRDHQGTVGLPLPGTEVRILDEKGGELGVGREGELAVRGPQVMKGYLETGEEAPRDFAKPAWLKTGDMAKLTEQAHVKILGRKKDMINVSGFKLYPLELERALMSFEKVSEAVLVPVKDSRGQEAVKAFIVPRKAPFPVEELQTYCRKIMAPYKVPKHIEFVGCIPKNLMGKPLRGQLKNRPFHPALPARGIR